MDWSKGVIRELTKATGVKKAVDKVAQPFFNYGSELIFAPLWHRLLRPLDGSVFKPTF